MSTQICTDRRIQTVQGFLLSVTVSIGASCVQPILPAQAQAKLHPPHWKTAEAGTGAPQAGDSTGRRAVYAVVRLTQISAIEKIEILPAELEPHRLPDFNLLQNRQTPEVQTP